MLSVEARHVGAHVAAQDQSMNFSAGVRALGLLRKVINKDVQRRARYCQLNVTSTIKF